MCVYKLKLSLFGNSFSATEQNELCVCNIYFTKYPIHLTSANWYCPARLHGFKSKEVVTGKGICK